jgi:C-terminal processing protease CtpA/Prc
MHLSQVNPGSLAAGSGLQIGDIVIKIGGTSTERLRHQDAQEQIGLAGNSLELSLERYLINV